MALDDAYELQTHLEGLYASAPLKYAVAGTSADGFASWQKAFRAELVELLGLAGREVPPVAAAKIHAEPREGYTEEKWVLDAGEGVQCPVYMLVPEGEGPFRTVMVFHGHSPSVQPIIGIFPDEETRRERMKKDSNYAQALAQAGIMVCAVEQRAFGERHSALRNQNTNAQSSCRHQSFYYAMLGRTMIGERCWDGMRAIDYVLSRDDTVPGALGCTGNSGGGTTALWLSAIEERISVAIPSCYFCSFQASVMGIPHCECNYVPGILKLAEMGDIAGLIAPRPFRVIAGEKDEIFPVAAVREQFGTVRKAYALAGVPEKCSLAVHDGPHAFKHEFAREWFDEWL